MTLPRTENLWMCVFYSMRNCQVCTGQGPRLFWEWFWTIFGFLAGRAFLTVLGQVHKRLVIRKGSKRVHLCFPFSEPGLWRWTYGNRGIPLLWVWQWERVIPWTWPWYIQADSSVSGQPTLLTYTLCTSTSSCWCLSSVDHSSLMPLVYSS